MQDYRVVLVEPSFEESIGFVARAMGNFGLRNLRLVSPVARIGKTARTRAGHAQSIIDNLRVFSSLTEALTGSDVSVGTTAQRARSLYRVLRRPSSPRKFASTVKSVHGTVALVFGREGTGLRNEELDMCDMVLTIPASDKYSTLNISHAAVILFYELYAAKRPSTRELLADQKVKLTLLRFLDNAASSAGLSSRERGLAVRAFRNIMGRSAIRAREASSLTGVFRTIAAGLNVESSAANKTT